MTDGGRMASSVRVGAAAAAGGLLVVAAGWWYLAVRAQPAPRVPTEPWARVQQVYPMPDRGAAIPQVAAGRLEAVVAANPFSPGRGRERAAGVPEGDSGAAVTVQPPEPEFVYKGRVTLGKKTRAIMEDRRSGKTYFLEVGQEVAGFKILDIVEQRVLLSDPRTHDEVVVPLTSGAEPS